MRPDIEDYEELTQVEDEAPRSRAMSWLVLVVAIGGFGALAYYAYHSGTQSMQDGDVMVVTADSTPIKEQPADPEGEQFANQDKTIYDVIAPNASENKVEKLLPEAEKPVAAPQEVVEDTPPSTPAPTTYVNKNLSTAGNVPVEAAKPAPLVVPVPSSTPPATAAVKPVEAAPQPEVKKAEPVKTETKPAAAATPVAASEDSGPTFVNESTVAGVKTEAKKAEEKPAVKKEAPVVKKEEPKKATAASSGSSQVQLGAFKSEEEASGAWKKAVAKSGGILSGSPTIVKADLPNGTFYRLRASVAGAAKDACAKLSAKGQACFPVK